MSFRQQQVESTLKRAISQVLTRQLSDPRISGLISVTRVETTPDLRQAFVFVSVVPDKKARTTMHGLNHAATHIHALVRKAVDMRTVPHLEFRLDEGLKKEASVLDAIRRGLARERDAGGAPGGEGAPAGGVADAGHDITTTTGESAPSASAPAPPPEGDGARREAGPPAAEGSAP